LEAELAEDVGDVRLDGCGDDERASDARRSSDAMTRSV
jgi:hypothetical protein